MKGTAQDASSAASTQAADAANTPQARGLRGLMERVITESGRPSLLTLGASLLVGALYYGVSRYSVHLQEAAGGVSVNWPAAGVALAAVYLGGMWMVPGLYLGVLTIGLTLGGQPWVILITSFASTLEPVLATVLLRRVGFDRKLRRFTDVFAFVAIAVIGCTALSAAIGALGEWSSGAIGLRSLGMIWRDWWIGDVSGVLLAGALLLVLADAVQRRLSLRKGLEAAAVTAAVAAVSYWLLDGPGAVSYLVLPLLFLLAFIYRQYGATLGIALIGRTAVFLTAHGHGPFFLTGEKVESLVRAEIFVCVGGITALLVAAAMSERRLTARALALLAESENALHESQHLARLGTFSLEFATRETLWSEELFHILGLDPTEVRPSFDAWRDCIVPDDLPQIDEITHRLYAESGASVGIHRIRRGDGQIRHIEMRLNFERDEGAAPDAPAARVRGTLQDVTELTSALERSRALFDHAPYPILVFGDNGTIRQCNRLAQKLFAADAKALVGQPISEYVFANDDNDRSWHEMPSEDGVYPAAELWGRRPDGHEFPAEVSLTRLPTEEGTFVSAAIRDVTDLRAASEKLNFQARHDALTGLPNRLMFLEQLELALARSLRSGNGLAVVFADLDNFKAVNDTRGHDVGDLLLTSLTPRLNAAVRHGDLVGRLGGDEFVVLCEDISDEYAALELAQRLVDNCNRVMMVAGQDHHVQLSAGVVMVADPDRVTAHSILRDADTAMYDAKTTGKGRVALFDEGTRERMVEQIAVETSLRGACARGEFELHYQPVFALDDQSVCQVEALLRWHHPLRGLLMPAEFMPVAESTGLIAEIGAWVLTEACRQAVRWRDGGHIGAGLPISVNISAYELTRSDLAGVVNQVLQTTGLEPQLLILEAKESALLQNEMIARRELGRLKALGVRLVIDDFGTGYSSLPALRNLSIDGLKLDRSFVHALDNDDDDGGMVGAVLSMASALDADVTAEGVETWRQVARLKMHGYSYAQGYLFSQPMPAERMTAMLVGDGERQTVAS
jgi:diguanylate cyclase (GGDEF)-like protein/PAS domain S-box-containing protein